MSKQTCVGAMVLMAVAACGSGSASPPANDKPMVAKVATPAPLDLLVLVEAHQLFVGPSTDDYPTPYADVVKALDAIPVHLPPDAHVTLVTGAGDDTTMRVDAVAPAAFHGAALGPAASFTEIARPHYAAIFDQLHHRPAMPGHRRALLVIASGCDFVRDDGPKRAQRLATLVGDGTRVAAVTYLGDSAMPGDRCDTTFTGAKVDVRAATERAKLPMLVGAAVEELAKP